MLKECCYKNVEPMATPRGERSGQLGVISNKKVRKDTDFFLGPSGPTKPWNWFLKTKVEDFSYG